MFINTHQILASCCLINSCVGEKEQRSVEKRGLAFGEVRSTDRRRR